MHRIFKLKIQYANHNQNTFVPGFAIRQFITA